MAISGRVKPPAVVRTGTDSDSSARRSLAPPVGSRLYRCNVLTNYPHTGGQAVGLPLLLIRWDFGQDRRLQYSFFFFLTRIYRQTAGSDQVHGGEDNQ